MAALLVFNLSLNTTHALSCLNPNEMIADYVSDERYNIARITAGELQTTGNEHQQTITVEENIKGITNTQVSFTYDDTWQYLCAGAPAEVDTQAVYITSDGIVSQVITIDSPLYESLMGALEENLAESPSTAEEEVERTLMQEIITLLQQIIGLLSGVSNNPVTEPTPVPPPLALIGMTTTEAATYAAANDLLYRIVEIDGIQQQTTEDYRPGRINATVEDNIVVRYTIEGEEVVDEATKPHNDIIGLSQLEAEAYAEQNNIPFRVGRIDDEFLPVTADYRPGRITAALEGGIVVDYSVE